MPPSSPPGERLLGLDVFRGLTVAARLLVNNPGTWSASYAPLQHAPWHGWTPTDLIFPLFCSSLASRRTCPPRRGAPGAGDRELVRQSSAPLLLGYWAATTLVPVPGQISERLTALFGAASLLMVGGLMWNWVFPINKNIWTSDGWHGRCGSCNVYMARGRAGAASVDYAVRRIPR